MSDKDVIRFQIHLSAKSHPALYETLSEAGTYRRSRRMLSLALTGLAVENGTIQLNELTSAVDAGEQTGATPRSKPQKAKGGEVPPATPVAETDKTAGAKYAIPEHADGAIDALFDAIS